MYFDIRLSKGYVMIIKNKNTHIKFITSVLLGTSIFYSNSFAQVYSIPQNQREEYSTIEKHLSEKKQKAGKLFSGNEDIVTTEKIKKPKIPYYSDVQMRVMNEFLEKEEYSKFFEYFSNIDVEDKAQIKYLLSKSDEGHIPLFWLMSHYYSLDGDAFNTHKWLYVAVIMTTQDANLCSDRTALLAPKTLLREFPHILTITTRTPQHIQPAVEDAARFIRALKHRTNPKWTCSYGTEGLDSSKNIVYDPANWPLVRKDILSDFLKPYGIK